MIVATVKQKNYGAKAKKTEHPGVVEIVPADFKIPAMPLHVEKNPFIKIFTKILTKIKYI